MTKSFQKHQYQKIPSVNSVLDPMKKTFPRIHALYLKRLVTKRIEDVRNNPEIYRLDTVSRVELEERIVNEIQHAVHGLLQGSLGKVINATGVVLHTGMGRAPLNQHLIEQLKEVSRYSNLEIRLDNGRRGQRNDHLSPLLCLLTGAEDGLAVNNNAAAVMLMLNTVGRRKEVIVSRGELIEIGGSFRMPEVMKLSGCKLCEIGTTNKTHLKDYADAVSSKTGAILLCHPSNYEVRGFTNKPFIEDIVKIGKKHDIPVIFDLGSGSLIDTNYFGSDSEPVVSDMVNMGLDLISFSGDKLLGGCQAGIIVGHKKWVEKCEKNQLLRALRLDKLMIKTMQLILMEYLAEDPLPDHLDAIDALTISNSDLKKRCSNFMNTLPESIQKDCELIATKGKVGSGAYPVMELKSWAISVNPGGMSASALAAKLRNRTIPVFSYIEKDKVCIDLRTVSDEEMVHLKQALVEILC
jgi:L-seryl-tRNA(Ser) seleniumtransferase